MYTGRRRKSGKEKEINKMEDKKNGGSMKERKNKMESERKNQEKVKKGK